MQLYSTNNQNLRVSFKEAIFNSLPADKGLYLPVEIPQLDREFIRDIEKYSFEEIAYKISETLLKDEIPAADLKTIIDDAINFDAPVVALDEKTAVLELFHGPSLAFKDFGARFMSRVMSYFLKPDEKILDVLVATSGDTGGAVALGFLGVPNTRVTILYPEGKVSPIQELQLTTNAENIRALEIKGTFDDCQALVKQAFGDKELNEKFRLTSANSINIARLIPQTFYYFHAYAQLKRKGKEKVLFSVPSGNFGNIAAGLLALKMGLPVEHFIAGTNVNDTVPRFLKTGKYDPKPSVQTYSNAMDVGAPSNWVRIMELFGEEPAELQKTLTSFSFSDVETLDGIKELYKKYGYIACPHTAIAWLAIQQYKNENGNKDYAAVFLSTAHPCKFPDIFPEDIRKAIKTPGQVQELNEKDKKVVQMPNSYEAFKAFLVERN